MHKGERLTVPFLTPDRTVSGFGFHNKLLREIDALEREAPERVAPFFADLILKLPTDTIGWNAIGVTPRPGGDLYQSTVLTLFGRVARSKEKTTALLTTLTEHTEKLVDRLKPDLLKGIAATAVTAEEIDPDASVEIFEWVDARLERKIYHTSFLDTISSTTRSSKELLGLAAAFQRKGASVIADHLAFWGKSRQELEQLAEETQITDR